MIYNLIILALATMSCGSVMEIPSSTESVTLSKKQLISGLTSAFMHKIKSELKTENDKIIIHTPETIYAIALVCSKLKEAHNYIGTIITEFLGGTQIQIQSLPRIEIYEKIYKEPRGEIPGYHIDDTNK